MQNKLNLIISLYSVVLSLVVFNFILSLYPIARRIATPTNEGLSAIKAMQKKDRKHLVYGFLPYWKLESAEYLQLDKLTDIAYFSLHIEPDGSLQKTTSEGYLEPGYNNWKNSKELDKLIKKSKEANVRFAVTIISHDDSVSDEFLNCRNCWKTLIDELIIELASKGLSDVNFDFEYVEYVDDGQEKLYTDFVAYANQRLDDEFGESFVTVSTFADATIKNRVTDVEALAKVSDVLFIMAYDFHQPTSDNAGPVAPINGMGIVASYDLNTMLRDYLKNISPDKLILGVPYYGYNWVVETPDQNASRIPGDDNIGYSQSQTYESIAETIINTRPVILWDELAQVPYFTYISPETGSTRMVYYENSRSLRSKYDLINSNDLKGVGIWALGYDGGYQELWDTLDESFEL